MLNAIFWGLLVGVSLFWGNYFFFVKAFPISKILKMNQMPKTVLIIGPYALGAFFIGSVRQYLLHQPDMQFQAFGLNDNIYLSFVVLLWGGSVIWFVIIPGLKERINKG